MFSSLSSLPMRGLVSSLSSEAAELMEQPSGGGMAGGWIQENIQSVSMSVNHGARDVCKGKINLLNHNKEDVGQTHDKCHGVLTGSRFGHCNMLTHTRSHTHTQTHTEWLFHFQNTSTCLNSLSYWCPNWLWWRWWCWRWSSESVHTNTAVIVAVISAALCYKFKLFGNWEHNPQPQADTHLFSQVQTWF